MSDRRLFLLWMLSFLGFPLGGLCAILIAGPMDGFSSALLGGFLTGLFIGTGQYLALRRRFRVGAEWIPSTAVALAVGNTAGTTLTGSGTGIGSLLVIGFFAGLCVGAAQWFVLRRRASARSWPFVVAAAWPIGWTVTWLVGVDVERGYTVFGASGALVFTALTGATLVLLSRR